jgi:hypothetical protein
VNRGSVLARARGFERLIQWGLSDSCSSAYQPKHFAKLLTVMAVEVFDSLPASSRAAMRMLIDGDVLSGTDR